MIKPLTSFRFIAAFFVFVHHLHYFKDNETLAPIYYSIFDYGYIGVTFFFVLSGFILTYSYKNKFMDGFDKKSLLDYFSTRIARIYPLHLLTLFLVVPWLMSSIIGNPLKYGIIAVINASLAQSFFPQQAIFLSYNPVSWSLSAEMFFYLLFPFVFFYLYRNLKTGKHILSSLAVLLISGILLAWLLRDYPFSKWMFYYFPVIRLWDFVAGILVALWILKVRTLVTSYKNWTVLEISSLLAFGITIFLSQYVHETLTWGMIYLPSICFIVWTFSYQKGYLSKLLSNKWLVFAGEISFAFYMIHHLVLRYLAVTGLPEIYPILNAFIGFSISLILSVLIFKYFEKPVIKRVKSKARTKKVGSLKTSS